MISIFEQHGGVGSHFHMHGQHGTPLFFNLINQKNNVERFLFMKFTWGMSLQRFLMGLVRGQFHLESARVF